MLMKYVYVHVNIMLVACLKNTHIFHDLCECSMSCILHCSQMGVQMGPHIKALKLRPPERDQTTLD